MDDDERAEVMEMLAGNEERPQHMKTEAEGMAGDLRGYVSAVEADEEQWAKTKAEYEKAIATAKARGEAEGSVPKVKYSSAFATAALEKLREPEDEKGKGKGKEKATSGSKYNAIFNSQRAPQLYAWLSQFKDHFGQTDFLGPNFLSSKLNVHFGVSDKWQSHKKLETK